MQNSISAFRDATIALYRRNRRVCLGLRTGAVFLLTISASGVLLYLSMPLAQLSHSMFSDDQKSRLEAAMLAVATAFMMTLAIGLVVTVVLTSWYRHVRPSSMV